jgi:hypothetical protein
VNFEWNSVYNAQSSILGYVAVGMLLVALNEWLRQTTKGVGTIQFVARDGYLPMKAFEILKKYDSDLPNTNYLYISRKALLLLDVFKMEDLFSLEAKLGVCNVSPYIIKDYFSSDCIDVEQLDKVSRLKGIDPTKKFETVEDFYKGISIFNDAVVNWGKHSEYCKKIVAELKKIVTPNNRFFDIGYSGRAESILSKLLGYSVDSLYFHVTNDLCAIRGKINNFRVNAFMNYMPVFSGLIREHVFMKTDPSLIRYTIEDDNNLQYVFEDKKISFVEKYITENIQDNALKFVQNFYDTYFEYLDWFVMPYNLVTLPYELYINSPRKKDRDIFSCIKFEDDMGTGRDIRIVDVWKAHDDEDCYYGSNQQMHPSLKTKIKWKIKKMANKLLPRGTRRREWAKKVYKKFRKM